jgi:23S rRNA (guanosine2251-2'-O)-methyltransferase
MFSTVLHTLQSPQNVGMIVRSHVAFGGDRIVMIGNEQPWRFGKGTQAFSRKLEGRCEFVYLRSEDEFFAWCEAGSWASVALEIASPPRYLDDFAFSARVALVVGNERSGLSSAFLARCTQVVTVPQFGAVGSMNVAVASSIAMYEMNRGRRPVAAVAGSKYAGEKPPG